MPQWEVKFTERPNADIIDAEYFQHEGGWSSFKDNDHKVVIDYRTETVLSVRRLNRGVQDTINLPSMRDAVAGLLRARGYRHDDTDPDDRDWAFGTAPAGDMIGCVIHELAVEAGLPVHDWNDERLLAESVHVAVNS